MSDVSPNGLINKDFYKNVRTNESLIACDDCGHEWKWKDTSLFESEYESSNKDKYFTISFGCRNCGKDYLVAVNNGITLAEVKELRRIEKSLNNLRIKAKKMKGKPTTQLMSDFDSMLEKHRRVMARIKKHQDQLKETFLSRKPELVLVNRKETSK